MGVTLQISKTDAAQIAVLLERASRFYLDSSSSSRAGNNARMCRRMAGKLRKKLSDIGNTNFK